MTLKKLLKLLMVRYFIFKTKEKTLKNFMDSMETDYFIIYPIRNLSIIPTIMKGKEAET